MSSFFDQSEAGPYYTVGGYLFRKSKVRPFEKEWGRMLKRFGLPYFRMSPCNAGKAPFDRLGDDGCDQCAREAIRIVKTYATYGYWATVRPADFDEIMGKDSFAGNAYALCSYLCLMGMRYWSDVNDKGALIGYFFESGTEHEADTSQLIGAIGLSSTRGFNFRYAGHAFVQKERSMPTQAADILAWQVNKNYLRADSGLKKLRGDFEALLTGVPTGHYELAPKSLHTFMQIIDRSTGGHPKAQFLAKWALRNDGKKFLSDPEAVLQLIAHQEAVGGQRP
jgi:hypothetical protein